MNRYKINEHFLLACIYKLIFASSKIKDVALLHFQYNKIEFAFHLQRKSHISNHIYSSHIKKNLYVFWSWEIYNSYFYLQNIVHTIHGDKNRSTIIIVCISGNVIHRMSRTNGNLPFKGLENIWCKVIFLYYI